MPKEIVLLTTLILLFLCLNNSTGTSEEYVAVSSERLVSIWFPYQERYHGLCQNSNVKEHRLCNFLCHKLNMIRGYCTASKCKCVFLIKEITEAIIENDNVASSSGKRNNKSPQFSESKTKNKNSFEDSKELQDSYEDDCLAPSILILISFILNAICLLIGILYLFRFIFRKLKRSRYQKTALSTIYNDEHMNEFAGINVEQSKALI